MVAHYYECTECHWIVHFKLVNVVLCKFQLNFFKKRNNRARHTTISLFVDEWMSPRLGEVHGLVREHWEGSRRPGSGLGAEQGSSQPLSFLVPEASSETSASPSTPRVPRLYPDLPRSPTHTLTQFRTTLKQETSPQDPIPFLAPLFPLREVPGTEGIVPVHVSFSLTDLSQIEKRLGFFSSNPDNYLKEFKYLT